MLQDKHRKISLSARRMKRCGAQGSILQTTKSLVKSDDLKHPLGSCNLSLGLMGFKGFKG